MADPQNHSYGGIVIERGSQTDRLSEMGPALGMLPSEPMTVRGIRRSTYRLSLASLLGPSRPKDGEKPTVDPKDHTSTGGDRIAAADDVRWPPLTRFVFRFVFAYVVLFLGSFAAFFAPLTIPIALVSQAVWGAIVPWVAQEILLVPPPPLISDGDGLGQWIQVGGCLVGAGIATILWSVLDRGRTNYVSLHEWLRVILRYALGIAMVTYGMAKIAHVQMLPPHLAKLVQPLGESSPTSLLWIFMGLSSAYSVFTGVIEAVGGALLFNRRTATLGALVSFGALSQVLALNLSYDVSAKLWSANLLLLTLILLIPELPRLLSLFVLNRPVPSLELRPVFRRERANRLAFRIGMLCVAITLGLRLYGLANERGRAYARTPTLLHGIYEVDLFSSNGSVLPPLLTDETRWRTVVFERSGLASVRFMNDVVVDFLTSVDRESGTVMFLANPDTTVTTAGETRLAYNPRDIAERFTEAEEASIDDPFTLAFIGPEDDQLTLRGFWGDDTIDVQLTRVDERDFLLLNRGLNWVQYSPYFR